MHFADFSPRTQTPDITICPPTSRQAAAELYQKIRYPKLDTCKKACTQMEIRTINIARQKKWSENLVLLIFRTEMTVSKEVQSYTLLSLVAEVLYKTASSRVGAYWQASGYKYVILK